MKKLGFVRVGNIVNKLVLADPISNANELVKMIKEAEREEVAIVSTPQLSLTGYTCGDLFFQQTLLEAAVAALNEICSHTEKHPKLTVAVGEAYTKISGGAQTDTVLDVAAKVANYFRNSGGDAEKATVTTDTATLWDGFRAGSGTFTVTDGSTSVSCDAAGNCKDL